MLKFWLCFVPLFVAVDALGVLPIFMGLTEGLEKTRVKCIIRDSVITAMIVAIMFLAIGKATFTFLGISISDFMIAGGTLLFALSIRELLSYEKQARSLDPDNIGAVPIGVPLIVGPGVLTTTFLLSDVYGPILTVFAVILNIIIAGVIFWLSEPINRILGKAGTRTISKLASLILASIGVMMVRKGIMTYVTAGNM